MHPASDCLPKYSFSWSNVIASDLAQVTFPLCSHVWRILLASVANPPVPVDRLGWGRLALVLSCFLHSCDGEEARQALLLDFPFTVLRLVPKARKSESNIIYDLGILYAVLWEKHLLCVCMKACGLKSQGIYGNELGRKAHLCAGALTGTIGTTCNICSPGGGIMTPGNINLKIDENLLSCESFCVKMANAGRDL